MEAKELRQFGAEELKGRVRQWREELFRTRFKGQSGEARDTSVCKKLKRDIARALTVLNSLSVSGGAAAQAVAPVGTEAKVKKAKTAKPAEDKAIAKPKAATKKKSE